MIREAIILRVSVHEGNLYLSPLKAPDPKSGGVDHGPRVYTHPTCHHAPEVYGGIGEARSAALLRAFFAERR